MALAHKLSFVYRSRDSSDEILEETASKLSNFSRTDTSNEKLERIFLSKGHQKVKKTKGKAHIMVRK